MQRVVHDYNLYTTLHKLPTLVFNSIFSNQSFTKNETNKREMMFTF